MGKVRSVLAGFLGMTADDVRAAKKAGVEVEEVFLFWRGRTREEFEMLYGGFSDSMDQYLKKVFINVPGGVIQLRSEVVKMREAKSDGEKEQEKAHSDAPEERTGASSEKRGGSQGRQRGGN